MKEYPYTSASIYKEDAESLDEYISKHGLKRRADGLNQIFKFAKSQGEM